MKDDWDVFEHVDYAGNRLCVSRGSGANPELYVRTRDANGETVDAVHLPWGQVVELRDALDKWLGSESAPAPAEERTEQEPAAPDAWAQVPRDIAAMRAQLDTIADRLFRSAQLAAPALRESFRYLAAQVAQAPAPVRVPTDVPAGTEETGTGTQEHWCGATHDHAAHAHTVADERLWCRGIKDIVYGWPEDEPAPAPVPVCSREHANGGSCS